MAERCFPATMQHPVAWRAGPSQAGSPSRSRCRPGTLRCGGSSRRRHRPCVRHGFGLLQPGPRRRTADQRRSSSPRSDSAGRSRPTQCRSSSSPAAWHWPAKASPGPHGLETREVASQGRFRYRVKTGRSRSCSMVAAVTVADDPVLVLGPALAGHLHASARTGRDGSSPRSAPDRSRLVRPSLARRPRLRLAATALAALALCMVLFVLSPWVRG